MHCTIHENWSTQVALESYHLSAYFYTDYGLHLLAWYPIACSTFSKETLIWKPNEGLGWGVNNRRFGTFHETWATKHAMTIKCTPYRERTYTPLSHQLFRAIAADLPSRHSIMYRMSGMDTMGMGHSWNVVGGWGGNGVVGIRWRGGRNSLKSGRGYQSKIIVMGFQLHDHCQDFTLFPLGFLFCFLYSSRHCRNRLHGLRSEPTSFGAPRLCSIKISNWRGCETERALTWSFSSSACRTGIDRVPI